MNLLLYQYVVDFPEQLKFYMKPKMLFGENNSMTLPSFDGQEKNLYNEK